jgi:hypothetical protein
MGLAYGAGFILQDADGRGAPRNSTSKFLTPASDSKSVRPAGAGGLNNALRMDAASPSAAPLLDRVRAIFSQQDDGEAGPRRAALIECLEEADASSMAAIAGLKELGRRDFAVDSDLVLEHWVLLDAAAAMAWQEKHGARPRTRSMLAAWAAKDPRAAMAWLQRMGLPNRYGEQRKRDGDSVVYAGLSLEETALTGWAQRDPAAAIAFRLDPANAALFPSAAESHPADHGVNLRAMVAAVQDSAGTAGLTKWLLQLPSMPHAPSDLASHAFSLACGSVTRKILHHPSAIGEFLRANAGQPWYRADAVRDTLWEMFRGRGDNFETLLAAGNRLGPDPASGMPWFTAESAIAREKAEQPAGDSPASPDNSTGSAP